MESYVYYSYTIQDRQVVSDKTSLFQSNTLCRSPTSDYISSYHLNGRIQVPRLFLLLSLFLPWSPQLLAEKISFNSSVLPILSDNCFQCHGPDDKTRQANLRLDQKETILRREDPVIIPGDVSGSQLITRISSSDPELQMPPPTFCSRKT